MTPPRARLAALALALALAGCTFLDAPAPRGPGDDGERPQPPRMEGDGPPCGRVALDVDPPSVAVGEPVTIVATLANCGDVTLSLDRGLCPDEGAGFRLNVVRGVNEFHLHARDVAEAAGIDDAPCAPGASVFGIPPPRGDIEVVHLVTFGWNATFAMDPCHPSPSHRTTACLQFAPALPGTYDLAARILAANATWIANATIVVEGEAPANATPCGRAGLDATAREFVVRVENCGATDLTLRDPCYVPYPIQVEIRRANATWHLVDGTGVSLRTCAPVHTHRVVPAGGHATARLAWDGQLDGAPAEPGEYHVVARLTAVEGWSHEALAVLTLAPERATPHTRARSRRAGGARAGARAARAACARRPTREAGLAFRRR